jgi:hypothetical protein
MITFYRQNPIFGEELADCWDELFDLQVIEDQRFKYVQFVAHPTESSLTPVIHVIEQSDHYTKSENENEWQKSKYLQQCKLGKIFSGK